MPRIRKETSNRVGTNDRRKLKNRIKESKRRKVKAAKKSTQWKSKHKKDPGIPNNFPYKDQILAEVAEQRRIAVEEKQSKKTKKKMQAASDPDGDDNEELAEGIASLAAQRLVVNKVVSAPPPQADEDEDDVPTLVNPDLTHLQAVLDEADVVIELLDCRDPLSCRSSHLENIIASQPSKELLLVLNKIDCCPREAVTAWLNQLTTEYPTFIFRSASAVIHQSATDSSAVALGDALGAEPILRHLQQRLNSTKVPLSVAVIGLTNVGKSSFINSLIRNNLFVVYDPESAENRPVTTCIPQEVNFEVDGSPIRFIDTPGILLENEPSKSDIQTVRARDILTRNRGKIERVKDTQPAVDSIVSRSNNEDLMLLYNVPFFENGDSSAFLSGLARSKQLIKQRSELDTAAASKLLLRDWGSGKFRRYTMPGDDTAAAKAGIQDTHSAILNMLKTRKEMKQDGGLVRLLHGSIEARKVRLEEIYVSPADYSDTRSEDEHYFGGGEVYSDELSEDDENDESGSVSLEVEQDNDENMAVSETHSSSTAGRKSKRKRSVQDTESQVKSKKVAFLIQSSSRQTKRSPSSQSGSQAGPIKKAATSVARGVIGETQSYNFDTYF